MKKSLLILAALLVTAPVFANEIKETVKQPLTLASADISASTNLKIVEANESTSRLEKEANAASDALSAAIEAKLAETIQKEVAVTVKF
jgi:hypothetical protein